MILAERDVDERPSGEGNQMVFFNCSEFFTDFQFLSKAGAPDWGVIEMH